MAALMRSYLHPTARLLVNAAPPAEPRAPWVGVYPALKMCRGRDAADVRNKPAGALGVRWPAPSEPLSAAFRPATQRYRAFLAPSAHMRSPSAHGPTGFIHFYAFIQTGTDRAAAPVMARASTCGSISTRQRSEGLAGWERPR